MLDINYIKENVDLVKKAVEQKAVDVDIDKLLEIDSKRRELISDVENLRQQRNEAAKNRDIEKGKELKEKLDSLEKELEEKQNQFSSLMLQLPNIPLAEVPEGDETQYKILGKKGEIPQFDFDPKDHVEIGEKLDIIDIQRAAKVSGSRFAYLKNEGALLELALVQFAMQKLLSNGFIPVIPPALIKFEMTNGLGYWQGKVDETHSANENYYFVNDIEEDAQKSNPLYLIGTGEHAIVPMHTDEIFEEKDLPRRYAAYSPCFRREVGTGGKDIRGILRVHQFEKVEMVSFVTPENDESERKKMLEIVEELMAELGLPYQIKLLPSGDMSFPAAETVDIETWIPSQNLYRETHSISTTTTFQSRRLKTRYRIGDGKTELVHILNGTALAIGRIIIAILENYQQADGSVKIPEALQKYTGFSEIRPKN